MQLPHYPLTNTGCNDANKVNANLDALVDAINDGTTISGFTPSRLIASDADGDLSAVNDLTDYIGGGTGITVTDDSDGTVTVANTDTGSGAVATHESTYDHSLLHSPVTVVDSGTVDLTLTGQQISASVIQSGVDHGSISGLTDDDHALYLLASGARVLTGAWENNPYAIAANGFIKTGWPASPGVTLSFDNSSRTFTVTDGGSAYYFINGTRYTLGGNKTVTITDTEGLWFIYFSGDTLTASQTPWSITDNNKALVAVVYWDATNNVEILTGYELHGYVIDAATHSRLHNAGGTAWSSGLAVTDALSNNVNISAGVVYDEDIRISITDGSGSSLFEQELSPGQLPIYSRSGASAWRKLEVASKNAVDDVGYVSGTDLQYNSLSGSDWVLTPVSGAKYIAMYVMATNDQDEPVVLILGQREDNTLSEAKSNNTFAEMSLTGIPFMEMLVLARLILKESGSGRYYTLEDVTDLRSSRLTGSTVAPTTAYQPLDADLTAISALSGTGIAVRTAADTWTTRSIAQGTGISVSNGDGVSGNPTVALSHLGIQSLADPNADRILFWDDSAGATAWLTASTGLSISGTTLTCTITQYTNEMAQDAVGGILTDSSSIDFTYTDASNQITAVVLPAGVDHNSLLNYSANRHIDHTTVTLTAGDGLTGGGDISTNRTFAVGAGTGIAVSADAVSLSHLGIQSLTDPNADRLMGWDDSAGATAWFTAGTGLSITDTTLACTITQYTDEMAQDAVGGALVDSSTIDFTYTDASNQITAAVLPGGIAHNDLASKQGGTAGEYYHLTSAQVSALHAAVTVADTSSVDLTLTGQQISAAVLPAGVDHSALGSLNTSSYTHLTAANHTTLTTAIIADSLHHHAGLWQSDNGAQAVWVDASGNLGFNKATPEGTFTGYNSYWFGPMTALYSRTTETTGTIAYWMHNCYFDTDGNFKRIVNDEFEQYVMNSGSHYWYYAASGAADTGVAPTLMMTLASTGLTLASITAATTDTDKFIVSDGGLLKYRTGAQVLSDIGAEASGTASSAISSHESTYNHSLLHAAATVADTTSIDLSISGQQISGVVLPAGVDHSALGSLNTSSYTHLTSANHTTLTTAIIADSLHHHAGLWESDNGAQAVWVDASGNVGVKISSPNSDLCVGATGNCYLDIIADSDNNGTNEDVGLRLFIDGVSGTGTQVGNLTYDESATWLVLGNGSGVAIGIDSNQYIHVPDDKYLFFGNDDDAWIIYSGGTNKLLISAEGSANPIEINADGLLEMYGLDGTKIGDQSLTYGDVDVYCLNGFTVHTNASPSEIAMYAGDEGIDCNVIVKAGYACKATSAGAGGSSGSPTQVDITAKSFVQLTPTANSQYYTFTGQEDYQFVFVEFTTQSYDPIYVNGIVCEPIYAQGYIFLYNGSTWRCYGGEYAAS